MSSHFTYLLILAGSLAGPVLLSFDKKVAFYRQWKFAFSASVLPAIFYILWDIRFTEDGVWDFNPAMITGLRVAGVPVEEILFFFVVPFCCTFIYACLKAWFPNIRFSAASDLALFLIGVILFAGAVIFRERAYTFYTCLFSAAFIFLFFIGRKQTRWFNTKLFLISYLVILLPFLIVNGLLTAIPVVTYNDAENIGLRLYTIPVEDVFYGLLLMFLNILIYERLMQTASLHSQETKLR